MPSTPFSRISVTLPPDILATADQLAQALERPRSWVIAEAIRRFGEHQAAGPVLSEELGLAQLRADLQLSPTDRVRSAEQAADPGRALGGPARDTWLSFERYEDYLEWDDRVRRKS